MVAVRDDAELHAEVHRLVHPRMLVARELCGRVPGTGTSAWWAAPDDAKIAGLLVLAEAWVIHDPERAVRQRLREMSYDLSQATDWTSAAQRPSHVELERRRAEPGPRWQSFDPQAAARWVATGSSEGSVA